MHVKLHVLLEHCISSSRKDVFTISEIWRCCWIKNCWGYEGGSRTPTVMRVNVPVQSVAEFLLIDPYRNIYL